MKRNLNLREGPLGWLPIILILIFLICCIPMARVGFELWRPNCETTYNGERTIRSQICTNKKSYDFGEPIYITFTITNVSREPQVLDGGDRSAVDIEIGYEDYDARKYINEYWSDDKELTPELTRITLKPGESYTLKWVWPTPRTNMEALRKYVLMTAIMGKCPITIYGLEFPLPSVELFTPIHISISD